MNTPYVEIYTDGSCNPNPGNGGWGAVLIFHDKDPVELSGSESDTTNNRMELLAAIKALEQLQDKWYVTLTTDSEYLCKGFSDNWVHKWEQNGWRTSSGKIVKNKDLWMRLSELNRLHSITWCWTRGHCDNRWNQRADLLASRASHSDAITGAQADK